MHVPHCLAPQTYVVSGIFDNEWCVLVHWSLTLPKASHKCKGLSCCAVHKSGCTSVRLSLKLLASCTSPGQQLPPKLETISCLSACLKSGTDRRTPEGACRDPKSPSLFPGLDWGTGLYAWGCAVTFLPMLCFLSSGIVFVPQTTAPNWLSLEWQKDRICYQELQGPKSSQVERAFYSCCVHKDFLANE